MGDITREIPILQVWGAERAEDSPQRSVCHQGRARRSGGSKCLWAPKYTGSPRAPFLAPAEASRAGVALEEASGSQLPEGRKPEPPPVSLK